MGVNWADSIFWLNVRRNIPDREDDYYTAEKTPPREVMEVSFLQSFTKELGNAEDTVQNSPVLFKRFFNMTVTSFSSLISVILRIWLEEPRPHVARREISACHWFPSLLTSLFLAIHTLFHHLQMAGGAGGNYKLHNYKLISIFVAEALSCAPTAQN